MKRLWHLMYKEARQRPLAAITVCTLAWLTSCLLAVVIPGIDDLSALRLRALSGSSELVLRVRAPEPETALSLQRRMLDKEDIRFVRELSGVEEVRVISGLPLPASMQVRIPGLINSRYDITLYTLSDEAVPDELKETWQSSEQQVPLLLNPQLITLYNLGFADRYRTPRLNREALLAINLPLEIGRDLFTTLDTVIGNHSGRVIGYSQDLPVWGAGIPQRFAEQWLPQLYPDGPPAGTGPVLATLYVRDLASMVAARAAIQERGLALEGSTGLAEAVLRDRRMARGIAWVGVACLVLIGSLATMCLAMAVVSERQQHLFLLRHLGARLPHLTWVFAGGLIISAMAGGLLGGITAAMSYPLLINHAAELFALDQMRGSLPKLLPLFTALAAGAIAATGLLPLLAWSARRPLLQQQRDS